MRLWGSGVGLVKDSNSTSEMFDGSVRPVFEARAQHAVVISDGRERAVLAQGQHHHGHPATEERVYDARQLCKVWCW